MADWPNSGQLPQPIGSDSFDPEMDMIGYSSILESEELSHYSQATQDIFQLRTPFSSLTRFRRRVSSRNTTFNLREPTTKVVSRIAIQ